MNISFTKKQEDYIASQVATGDFQNASEVVRDAMRLHLHYRHKMLEELRAAIDEGLNSPVSDKTMDDILQEQRAKYSKK
ncbi:MAG: antitoxin ParD1/3/4 [Granulosicoccus sp.]|jgi:antitoxin ParD1/3/4